jgi:hypothetical protein
MTDPTIRAALEAAAKRLCICDGECFETRIGDGYGPCEKETYKAVNALASFLYAVNRSKWPRAIWLADAVLAAAAEQATKEGEQ